MSRGVPKQTEGGGVGSGCGSKKKKGGEAGMGRLVSHSLALYHERRRVRGVVGSEM